MRVAVLYPPLWWPGRVPVLSQSRVFSFTHSREIRIYPLVMAQAATLLSRAGFETFWLDGIAAGWSMDEFWREVESCSPDLVIVETKTPVIRRHWEFLREIKMRFPGIRSVLVGDHVSLFPEESMRSCSVDCVVTGGDYDVSILAVARSLRGESVTIPGGVWTRGDGGEPVEPARPCGCSQPLNELPWVDRDLTKWRLYGEAYLHRPVAYILSGRGCGTLKGDVGNCTFCVWQYAFWRQSARLRDPRDVAREIAALAAAGAREVFDDNEAGGIWDLEWLRAFTAELVRLKVAGRIAISSNCRADSVTPERCDLMKTAGYRMLKIALESGNDETLRRLSKGETVADVVRGVRLAKDYGFAVMVSVMVGFPWESDRDVGRTVEVARDLLLYRSRIGDCLEANLVIPYPGTPLHDYVRERGWLTVDVSDYDGYGKTRPVVQSPVDAIAWGQRIWRLHLDPAFLAKVLLSVRRWRDLELGLRGIRSLVGHTKDYAA